MKKRWRTVLIPCLVLALLCGCWQEEAPEEPGLLGPEEAPQQIEEEPLLLPEEFALPYVPEEPLDPITCSDGMQQVIGSLVFEGLFRLDGNLEPTYRLCESFMYHPESLTYTFVLRQDAVFSDGSPLTAADVRDSLKRAQESERYGARLAQIAGVSAQDGLVTMKLSTPNTGLPALLDVPIVKLEGDLPLGTGPYSFSREEGELCLRENPHWWRQERRPVERIALVETSGRESMLYRFNSHDVQLITADLTGTEPVTATGSVDYADTDTTLFQFIGCNIAREALGDASLRKALSQAINREQITGSYFSGHGLPAQFPLSPVSPLYPGKLETPYSHEESFKALSAKSVDQPLTLLVNQENAFKTAAAEYLAQNWSDAGVAVEVRALPWEAYLEALSAGDFDLYYGEVRLTADWNLQPLVGSGGSLNYGGWADEKTEELLAAYAQEQDGHGRGGAMEELCTYLRDQSPVFPICFKSTSVLTQGGVVEGAVPSMTEPLFNLPSCVIHLRES